MDFVSLAEAMTAIGMTREKVDTARLAETHGIRFPREFTLLLKQFLYFDG